HVGEFAQRLAGSSDLYQDDGRHPFASINFITAHDGFTLRDLVSYNEKHNEANQEGNRDGTDDNRSWNCGEEGPTDDPEIIALRCRQQRNFLATLLLSQGTPMLLGGDEFARSQKGNNNSYCQDNEISWVDWPGMDERGRALVEFAKQLLALRRDQPVLRRSRFLMGEWNEALEIKDVTWLAADGHEMQAEHWDDARLLCFGMLLDGRAQTSGIVRRSADASVLIVFNAWHDAVEFLLPPAAAYGSWARVIDTATPEPAPPPMFDGGASYLITGRSMLVFVAGAPDEGKR
ncbi:MAG TPA: glycogen debranching enzyme GlgX, partial [Burkholderiaceae bacterium]|nr:glycogen debranching enzyme GlgX [Burkholderiaceae bacterium]